MPVLPRKLFIAYRNNDLPGAIHKSFLFIPRNKIPLTLSVIRPDLIHHSLVHGIAIPVYETLFGAKLECLLGISSCCYKGENDKTTNSGNWIQETVWWCEHDWYSCKNKETMVGIVLVYCDYRCIENFLYSNQFSFRKFKLKNDLLVQNISSVIQLADV